MTITLDKRIADELKAEHRKFFLENKRLREALRAGADIVDSMNKANAVLIAEDVDDQPQLVPDAYEALTDAFKALDAWLPKARALLAELEPKD